MATDPSPTRRLVVISLGWQGRKARHGPPVPSSPVPLIGRTEERKAIARRRHRSDVRPVVLLGPGGVGTTRLAIEVAAEAAPRFAAGHVVSVAAVQDHEPVLQAVADEIGLPKGPQPLPERRASQIRPQRMLLVRHNVEHVAKAATGIARITHREGDVQWLLAGG